MVDYETVLAILLSVFGQQGDGPSLLGCKQTDNIRDVGLLDKLSEKLKEKREHLKQKILFHQPMLVCTPVRFRWPKWWNIAVRNLAASTVFTRFNYQELFCFLI